jgi:hypothetical protein
MVFLLGMIPLFPASSDSPTSDDPPANMALIPGGEFVMGIDGDVDDNTTHKVVVDSLRIFEFK